MAELYAVKGESLSSIADAIREKTGSAEKLELSEMPGAIRGIQAGSGSYDQGFAAGKQAEYDAFWDAFQQNGEKTEYDQAFMMSHWTDATFNPKHPLRFEGTSGGRQVFSANRLLTDIKVPVYAKNTRLVYTFNNCTALKTIPLLRIEGVTDFNSCFLGCYALENIVVEGLVEKNISFEACTKLTHDSLMSIIHALMNYADSGSTYSVTLGAENLAKLTDAEKMIAVNKGWTLVGWTPPENAYGYCGCGAMLNEDGNCTEMNDSNCEGWTEE